MSSFAIPRPTSGDIVDVILLDHQVMESLMRDLRNDSLDREAARQAFAALFVAHGEAEEDVVYPKLKRRARNVGSHEVEHGKEEHAEGMSCLLELLEAKGTDTQKYDDAAEKMSAYFYHHVVEEELTMLNPAREEIGAAARKQIGGDFLIARSKLLDDDCGRIENVRALVKQAIADGKIPDEPLPEKP
ncbi:hemerythrin domain-containing protein [Enemella sp. A6]|uniref:hemerythrin domain-containing protein n=1 Tax=Enemella sp. A6 TaxID=3440152 RepID=UPI003EBA0E19